MSERGRSSDVTRQEQKWALMEQHKQANGTTVSIPIGTTCADCWQFWNDTYRWKCDFDQLCAISNTNEDEKKAISTARMVWKQAHKPTFPQDQVVRSTVARLCLERHYVALTESEFRSALGVPRLLKSHLKGVPCLSVASEADAGVDEPVYLFGNPDMPYRTAKLVTEHGVEAQGLVMERSKSSFDLQGRHCVGKTFRAATVEDKDLLSVKAPTLDDHLAALGVIRRRKPGVSHVADHASARSGGGDDDEADFIGESSRELVGVAARDAGLALEGLASSSLVSPSKSRPPVPGFASADAPPPLRLDKRLSIQDLESTSGGGGDSGGAQSEHDDEGSGYDGEDCDDDDASGIVPCQHTCNAQASFLLVFCLCFVFAFFRGGVSNHRGEGVTRSLHFGVSP